MTDNPRSDKPDILKTDIKNFNMFKSIAGITFVLALMLTFLHLLSEENNLLGPSM